APTAPALVRQPRRLRPPATPGPRREGPEGRDGHDRPRPLRGAAHLRRRRGGRCLRDGLGPGGGPTRGGAEAVPPRRGHDGRGLRADLPAPRLPPAVVASPGNIGEKLPEIACEVTSTDRGIRGGAEGVHEGPPEGGAVVGAGRPALACSSAGPDDHLG